MRARHHSAGSLLCTSLAAALIAACAKSSTAPADGSSGKILQGQTVDAIAGSGMGGVSVQVGPAYTVLTDGNGYFQADVGGPGTYSATITGGSVVDRRTMVTG